MLVSAEKKMVHEMKRTIMFSLQSKVDVTCIMPNIKASWHSFYISSLFNASKQSFDSFKSVGEIDLGISSFGAR